MTSTATDYNYSSTKEVKSRVCDAPGAFPDEGDDVRRAQPAPEPSSAWSAPPPKDRNRFDSNKTYKPRQCRICLEVIQPTIVPGSSSVPGLPPSAPHVIYESSDPIDGRLISPCRCRGSARYVHEGCLQQWRAANPGNRSNYYECPTCHYRYRLERLTWARHISSSAAQIALTTTIFVVSMFVMGFVADPVINIYLDPWGSLTWMLYGGPGPFEPIEIIADEEEELLGWFEHFFKGAAGLGVVGFMKVILFNPFQYWRMRNLGIGGGQRANAAGTGRDRAANISWVVIMLGIGTFLWVSIAAYRLWSVFN